MSNPDERDQTQRSYETAGAVQDFGEASLKWTERQVLERYFARLGRVLDLGCGTGRTSRFLQAAGHQVVAIDYSEPMIRKARENCAGLPIEFLIMDARRLEFPDASFDYALFSFNGPDYLHPEAARLEALREIHRVLKPGGVFAFSSHNSQFIPNTLPRLQAFLRSALRFRIHLYRWDFQAYGPLLTYCISPKAQLRQLAAAGFQDVEVISKYSKDLRQITFRDPYPTYVCRKPA